VNDFNDWDATLDVWKSGQILLPKVTRWKKYTKDEDTDGGGIVQNTLEHSYSLALLGEILLLSLGKYEPNYDHKLFLTACLLHDHGEGELERDVLYIDKEPDGHVNEYIAFKQRFSTLKTEVYESLEQAFLLQFARLEKAEIARFPKQAQEQIEYLQTNKQKEALAFEALERWDYVLYALEQYKERRNEKILVQVLRNQIPELNKLASLMPGFEEEVWTKKARDWFEQFVEERNGKWIEQKGEM